MKEAHTPRTMRDLRFWKERREKAPFANSMPFAREEVLGQLPSCLTLRSGETAAATLVVSTTGLEAPGINHVIVSVGFRVSPSGWSAGTSTTVLVHIIPDELLRLDNRPVSY